MKFSFFDKYGTTFNFILQFYDKFEVILRLIQGKYMPILLYGLETCPLKYSDFRSLDFIIDRFFMKLFRTINVDTVTLCQEYFNFELPSDTVKRRTLKFESTFVSITLVKM